MFRGYEHKYEHGTYSSWRHGCNCDLCIKGSRIAGNRWYIERRKRNKLTLRKFNVFGYEIEFTGYKTPCYLWTGSKFPNGYAKWPKTSTGGHREMYKMVHGEIPLGLHLDHLCRIKHCIRPDHLEPVTCAVNTRRSKLPHGEYIK